MTVYASFLQGALALENSEYSTKIYCRHLLEELRYFVVLFQGRAADLKFIESAARKIAEVATDNKIVVEKSTVPVKAAQSISQILRANHSPGVRFQVP